MVWVTVVLLAGCTGVSNSSVPDGVWRDDATGFEFDTAGGLVVHYKVPGQFDSFLSPGIAIGFDGSFAEGRANDVSYTGDILNGKIQGTSASGTVGYHYAFGICGFATTCNSVLVSWSATYKGPGG